MRTLCFILLVGLPRVGLSRPSYQAHAMPFFDVTQSPYDAVGDYVADDTQSIQAAIDAATEAKGGIVYLPPGRYRVTESLVIEKCQGVRLVGVGRSGDWKAGSTSFHGSSLAWEGADGGTLIKVRGGICVSFERLVLIGKDAADSTKTATLVSCLNHADGSATGGVSFVDCSFFHANSCVRFGESVSDNNCDTSRFMGCGFKNFVSAIDVRGNQGIEYQVDHCGFSAGTNAIALAAGGNLTASRITSVDVRWMLRLGRGGRNVASVLINGGHSEATTAWATAGNRPGIIYCDSDSAACSYVATVRAYHVSAEAGPEAITPYAATFSNVLNKGVVVIFEGCVLNAHDFASLEGTAPVLTTLVLRNCKLWQNSVTTSHWITENGEGGTQVIDEGCLDAFNRVVVF